MKGVKGVTIGKLEALDPGQPAPYYRITSFYFDSREAYEAMLASPEGQAILADLNNFATGGVSIVANEPAIFMNSFTFFTQPVLLSDVCNSLKPGCSRAQG